MKSPRTNPPWDAIIVGAGASGLMCALSAGERGRKILLLDHQEKAGKKIAVSGGGHCNFSNLNVSYQNYLSENPKFCLSALSRFTPWDFISLLKSGCIVFSEKKESQLFCVGRAQQVTDLLLERCRAHHVSLRMGEKIQKIVKTEAGFFVETAGRVEKARALVVATGGKSYPKLGATGLGYALARQFQHVVVPPQPALVPMVWGEGAAGKLKSLAGITVDVVARCGRTTFAGALLFTHKGLSGPVILQLSSYWRSGETIHINLWPGGNLWDLLQESRKNRSQQTVLSVLTACLPKRLAQWMAQTQGVVETRVADLSKAQGQRCIDGVHHWSIAPFGTEGYQTAEVTKGGVDTRELSSKTMASRKVAGLYFIGEVVDVTGQLGGYNLQWAWSSGWVAGQNL